MLSKIQTNLEKYIFYISKYYNNINTCTIKIVEKYYKIIQNIFFLNVLQIFFKYNIYILYINIIFIYYISI